MTPSFIDLDRTKYESQQGLLLLSHLFDSYSHALAWETSKMDVCKRTLSFGVDAPRHSSIMSPSFILYICNLLSRFSLHRQEKQQ